MQALVCLLLARSLVFHKNRMQSVPILLTSLLLSINTSGDNTVHNLSPY